MAMTVKCGMAVNCGDLLLSLGPALESWLWLLRAILWNRVLRGAFAPAHFWRPKTCLVVWMRSLCLDHVRVMAQPYAFPIFFWPLINVW